MDQTKTYVWEPSIPLCNAALAVLIGLYSIHSVKISWKAIHLACITRKSYEQASVWANFFLLESFQKLRKCFSNIFWANPNVSKNEQNQYFHTILCLYSMEVKLSDILSTCPFQKILERLQKSIIHSLLFRWSYEQGSN